MIMNTVRVGGSGADDSSLQEPRRQDTSEDESYATIHDGWTNVEDVFHHMKHLMKFVSKRRKEV